MNKQELIEAIAKERALIAEAASRVNNLRIELAKYAEWQVGDIVTITPYTSFRYRIMTVGEIDDAGNLTAVTAQMYKKSAETWSDRELTLPSSDIQRFKLIERPSGQSTNVTTAADSTETGE